MRHPRKATTKRARSNGGGPSRARGEVSPLRLSDEPKPCRVRIVRGNLQVSFVCPDEAGLDVPEVLDHVAQDAIVLMLAEQEEHPGTATLPLSTGVAYRIVMAGEPGLAVDPATGLVHRERVYRLEDDLL